jgi:putative GTP pyrophosphokinase
VSKARKIPTNLSAVTSKQARDFVSEYAAKHSLYQQFAQKVDSLVLELLKKRQISTHATEYRAKSIEGFSEKIRRPGKSYKDPLVELSDLSGNRVILHYQEDVDTVCSLLRKEFRVDDSRSVNKSEELEFDRFTRQIKTPAF